MNFTLVANGFRIEGSQAAVLVTVHCEKILYECRDVSLKMLEKYRILTLVGISILTKQKLNILII